MLSYKVWSFVFFTCSTEFYNRNSAWNVGTSDSSACARISLVSQLNFWHVCLVGFSSYYIYLYIFRFILISALKWLQQVPPKLGTLQRSYQITRRHNSEDSKPNIISRRSCFVQNFRCMRAVHKETELFYVCEVADWTKGHRFLWRCFSFSPQPDWLWTPLLLLFIGLTESSFLGQKVTGVHYVHCEVHLCIYTRFCGMVTLRLLAVSVFLVWRWLSEIIFLWLFACQETEGTGISYKLDGRPNYVNFIYCS